MTAPQPTTPPRKRRWYQFSLRTLMIVMLLASVGMSWFAVKLQQARRQRAAVEAMGGVFVCYESEYDLSRDYVKFFREPSHFGWFRELLGDDFFEDVVGIEIWQDDAKVLQHLHEFPRLRWLSLRRSAEVTDDSLARIAGLTNLRVLQLSETAISDAGLKHLRGLDQLVGLDLTYTNITDEGLGCLKRLRQLKNLNLPSKVTSRGIQDLAKALPDCNIE